jgi:hypothetical protein
MLFSHPFCKKSCSHTFIMVFYELSGNYKFGFSSVVFIRFFDQLNLTYSLL